PICDRGGEIDRRCCLADSAFLIGNRDDGSHSYLPPRIRTLFIRPFAGALSAADPATAFLVIGVVQENPPRTRVTLRSYPLEVQGKSGLQGGDQWKTPGRRSQAAL